jgi:PPP family 3-phenylpropionic acid transporter
VTNPRSLAAYYFWYFAAVGVFEPYLAPFWREAGFSPREFGFLLALLPGVAIAAPFLWTAAADLTRRVQPIFLFNTALCAVVAFLIPALRDFVPAAAAVLVFSLARSPLIPIANSFTLRALGGSPERYAGVRLWGTIGYIAAAVVAGSLMDRIGLARGIYGIGLAMLACAVTAWVGRSRDRLALPPARLRDIGRVLADRRLQRLLVAGGLARLSYCPYETFYTIHLGQLGLSRTFAGAAWALAAASELAVMLRWRRLCQRAGPRAWLGLGLGAHVVRWGLLAVAAGPVSLLAIQLTHALTFGAFYLAAVQEVDAAAPDGLRATAQGAFSSVTFALGGFLGNTLSGLLYEPLGIRGLYVAASVVAAAATAVYALDSRRVREAGA